MTYAYDPELEDAVRFIPTLDISDLASARSKINAFVKTANKKLKFDRLNIKDIQIGASTGNHTITIRLYEPIDKPHNGSKDAALLYLHGGGFVMGNIETEHASIALLCEQLKITVVSVEYRLAPEHPYPAALDDCYSALRWLHNHQENPGIDPKRVGVMGVSAGGGLAAALALKCRDMDAPLLCFQCLDMPVLDDRLQTPSMLRFHDTPMWDQPSALLSWQYYLRAVHEKSDPPYLAAPARATDLKNLPPAYITAMEFDPLRDEAINYAQQLLASGVSVELHHYPGTFHGSAMIQTAAISRRQRADKLEALRNGLRITR